MLTPANTNVMNQTARNSPDIYQAVIRNLIAKIGDMPKTALRLQVDVAQTAQQMLDGLKIGVREEDHTAKLVNKLLEPNLDDTHEWLDRLADQFLTWRRQSPKATLPLSGILQKLCSRTPGLENHALFAPALMACMLASVPNNLPFHNQHHTRDVVCLMIALTHAQHKLKPFDDYETVLLENVIAACVHDFCHDGQGNLRMGKHTPMRLEQHALDQAHPFLKQAGIEDASWQRIKVIVLCTDVSKVNETGEKSPADWIRKAYARGVGDVPAECPTVLMPIFTDKDLTTQAMLLEEADVATSAGMPYNYARRMTALIAEETKVLSPTPETLIGFIDHICHQEFVSEAGVQLFSANLMRTRAEAKKETADTIYNWS